MQPEKQPLRAAETVAKTKVSAPWFTWQGFWFALAIIAVILISGHFDG